MIFSYFVLGIIAGVVVSAISYTIIELIKAQLLKRKQYIDECNYIVTILLEIKRAIKRSETYIDWAIDGIESYSKLYTYSYESSLVELIKINSNPITIDKINYIYSIFFFVNYNIDKGRYKNGIGFLKDHLLKIFDNYDGLIRIMEKRKSMNNKINLPKVLVHISECRKDSFKEKRKKLEKIKVPNTKQFIGK